MTQRRIKLSILLLILITGLAIFIINLNDEASAEHSPNLGFISSNTQILEPTIKTEDIISTSTDTPNTKGTLEGASTENGQMIVMHRPVWKFDENLIVHIAKLKIASSNGDHEASYILAMNLRYCYPSPADDIALEKKLEEVSDFSDSERAVGIILERYEYCLGIVQKERSQFHKYSEAAANNGYVPAQEVIARTTSESFMESQGYDYLEREEFITMRDNFVKQQVVFLEQAAKNGSIKALTRLSRLNRSQKLGGNGYAKSFAFNQLILELTQNNKIYDRHSRYQQKLHSQLTPKEIDDAFAMSEEWLEIIKANGTLYLTEN